MNRLEQDKTSVRSGFTLFELTIAIVILSIAVLSLYSLMINCMRMDAMSDQMNIAVDAASNKMEEIRNTPFAQIIPTFASDDINPQGIYSGWFSVDGLMPAFADADGFVGKVIVFTNEVLWTSDARYAGLPMDLNGNQLYEWGNLYGSPKPPLIYPVVVKIEWDGIGGVDRSFSLRTLITKRD